MDSVRNERERTDPRHESNHGAEEQDTLAQMPSTSYPSSPLEPSNEQGDFHEASNSSPITLDRQLSVSKSSNNTPTSLEKPRLSTSQKKENHIASEQKRRQAIREGFDSLADIVPGMKGHGRSEAMVLQGASQLLRELLAERWSLVEEARRRGIDVDVRPAPRYVRRNSGDAERVDWLLDDGTMTLARAIAEEEEDRREAVFLNKDAWKGEGKGRAATAVMSSGKKK